MIDKIKDIPVKDRGYKKKTRKHETISELKVIKQTNERYLILYQLEGRGDAVITQCYIFEYNY